MKLQDNLALLPTAAVAALLEVGIVGAYLIFRGADGFIQVKGDRFLLAAQGYLIAACVLSYLWGLFWTRPLSDIFEGISAYGKGNFSHRIGPSKVKELDELARHLNQMSDRLRELDQLKSEFVANVSHELRSPLAAMEGYVTLLLSQVDGPLQTRENLLKIGSNISRLRRLVENLLDLSKIESRDFPIHSEAVHAHEVVREVCGLFEAALKNKGLTLDFDWPADVPAVKADPSKLRQIVTNLLDNAIKYNRPSGFVKIAASRTREASGALTISVQDSGCGILPEYMPHLFERFRRLPGGTRSTQVNGTGLGLAISRDLARSMGGDILAESRPELGSVFFLILPVWEGR